MSRPRKPYGPNPPGRLQGTMIKVLAAELSDQGRLARGKRYWADNAVIDIVVGHGAVTAEIQGSRQTPYVVTLEAESGQGLPSKRELWVQCTCPDDSGTGADACKHAVAALFALSDEVTVDPGLIDRWRAGRRGGSTTAVSSVTEHRARVRAESDDADDDDDDADADDADADDDDGRGAQVIQLFGRGASSERHGDSPPVVSHTPNPQADEISALLRSPAGAAAPEFPRLEPLDHPRIRDPLLAEVFADALGTLAIRWE